MYARVWNQLKNTSFFFFFGCLQRDLNDRECNNFNFQIIISMMIFSFLIWWTTTRDCRDVSTRFEYVCVRVFVCGCDVPRRKCTSEILSSIHLFLITFLLLLFFSNIFADYVVAQRNENTRVYGIVTVDALELHGSPRIYNKSNGVGIRPEKIVLVMSGTGIRHGNMEIITIKHTPKYYIIRVYTYYYYCVSINVLSIGMVISHVRVCVMVFDMDNNTSKYTDRTYKRFSVHDMCIQCYITSCRTRKRVQRYKYSV